MNVVIDTPPGHDPVIITRPPELAKIFMNGTQDEGRCVFDNGDNSGFSSSPFGP